jgi:hypothetical protein
MDRDDAFQAGVAALARARTYWEDALRTPAGDPAGGLTPFSGASYHPPDDDAPRAFGRRRVCVPLRGAVDKSPRPDGEDPGQSR